MVRRALLIPGGAFLLVANSMGDENTFLGFYPPDNAQRIGFNMAKLAIAALALWMVYRSIRPKRVSTTS